MSKKLVLAYSGGLDTSVAIEWLKIHKGYEVIACAMDVGQAAEGEMERIRQRALDCGASDAVIFDARAEFADQFVAACIRANGKYMGKYPLVSALSRPLIVKHLVEVAKAHGADAIAHGCTGKGNDQVRFDVAAMALAPHLTVEAPIREWGLTRDAALDFAAEHGIPVVAKKENPYSIDENLWGRAAECGALEDPWVAPPSDIYAMTTHPVDAPDTPEEVELTFAGGIPVALDGQVMDLFSIIATLNTRAGAHGIGRLDMVEDRLVGIKSREVYEFPAAAVIMAAHEELENLTVETELAVGMKDASAVWAKLVYNGLWYGPYKQALDAFFMQANTSIEGDVRLSMYKGTVAPTGRRSEKSLYQRGLATYDASDEFDHSMALGFVKLWGLPTKVWAETNGDQ
ncbi:argininosuccinate synthase [Stomatohabitans albus]|uniref:argininosuccinate synthase n=1 Tax=Stomatohabitans albus TaxID=3110766 RepID=UPI00300C74D8